MSRGRDAAKDPTMCRAALHNKTLSGLKCLFCQETLDSADLVPEAPSSGELGLPTNFDDSSQAVVMFHVVLCSEWKALKYRS